MDSTYPRLEELFDQLGLPSGTGSINFFIAQNSPLKNHTRLADAAFWTASQAKLIANTDAAVAVVAENPDAGERKKGDLAELWVYKFRRQGQLYLLDYTREDTARLICLEALGPHENFYRDLKKH